MLTWLTIFGIGFLAHLLFLFAQFLWRSIPRCEKCTVVFHRTTFFGLSYEESRTMYHWNGEGKDPNAHLLLCSECAILHHEFWDDMWDQYNAGRL